MKAYPDSWYAEQIHHEQGLLRAYYDDWVNEHIVSSAISVAADISMSLRIWKARLLLLQSLGSPSDASTVSSRSAAIKKRRI